VRILFTIMTGTWTDLLVAQIQQLVELDTTVGKGTEGPPLLKFSGDFGVSDFSLVVLSAPQSLIKDFYSVPWVADFGS
jgi:hypothetical protein